jgi:hypothetical protein
MEDSTIPLNQAEMPVLEVLKAEALPEVRSPVYHWSTGSVFVVNKRQKVVVDALLEKEDFKYVKTRYKDEFGSEISLSEIRKMLEYTNVQDYLNARVEEKGIGAGLTLDAYIALGYKVMQGEVKWSAEQVAVWKQLAKVRGFETSGGTQIINSIEIVQKNGEK